MKKNIAKKYMVKAIPKVVTIKNRDLIAKLDG